MFFYRAIKRIQDCLLNTYIANILKVSIFFSKIGRSYSWVKISCSEFMCIENDLLFPGSYDYLKISDGGSHTFDDYCGEKTGESIEVTGDQVVLTFHSDDIVQRRGFLIFFTAVPLGRYSENGM